MTYFSNLKVEMRVQVYILWKSDKAKTDKNLIICRKVLSDNEEEMVIGSLPLMVKSKQC